MVRRKNTNLRKKVLIWHTIANSMGHGPLSHFGPLPHSGPPDPQFHRPCEVTSSCLHTCIPYIERQIDSRSYVAGKWHSEFILQVTKFKQYNFLGPQVGKIQTSKEQIQINFKTWRSNFLLVVTTTRLVVVVIKFCCLYI